MEGLKIVGVEVTADAAANVIETAIAAGHTFGMGYWATVTRIKHFAIDGEPDRERIWSVRIYDNEGGGATDAAPDSHFALNARKGYLVITVEHVKKAIAQMLSDPAATDAAGWIARIVTDDPDGPLADAIIQVACFGKVIYG